MSLTERLAGLFRNIAVTTGGLDMLREIYGGYPNASGTVVTSAQALTLSTVWACVRVLSETMGQVPLRLYQETDDGAQPATAHPTSLLLRGRVNAWQTSYEFRETLMAHVVLRGNGYALLTFVGNKVREMIACPPEWVTMYINPTTLVQSYNVTFPNGRVLEDIPPERMLHIPGLSWDGRTGLSVINYWREFLGVAAAQQTYAAKIYANGLAVRGVIEHPKPLTVPTAQKLKDKFDAIYGGNENSFKTMLLEEGMTYKPVSMTAHDAEFLASRHFTRSEIAGAFRVPLHLVGDLTRSTNNNIEHQSLEFVMFTMMPWFVRWEERLGAVLLTDAERERPKGRLYLKFVAQALLRGDFKTRTEGYGQAIRDGWMSRNEARSLEDLNKVPGLDEFILPINFANAGAVSDPARDLKASSGSGGGGDPTGGSSGKQKASLERDLEGIVRHLSSRNGNGSDA